MIGPVKDEAGFSLIEALVLVPLLMLISGVIAAALIVGFRTTDKTSLRFAESHDAQMLEFSLVKDALSAQTVNPSAANLGCDPAGADPTQLGDNVLQLKWQEEKFRTIGTVKHAEQGDFEASYRYRIADTGGQLLHFRCGTSYAGGQKRSCSSYRLIAQNLSTTQPPVYVADATNPHKITLRITEASGFVYEVSSDRRTRATFATTTTVPSTTTTSVVAGCP